MSLDDDSMDVEEPFGGGNDALNASFDSSMLAPSVPPAYATRLRQATSWDDQDRSLHLPELPPSASRKSRRDHSTPVRLSFRPPGRSVSSKKGVSASRHLKSPFRKPTPPALRLAAAKAPEDETPKQPRPPKISLSAQGASLETTQSTLESMDSSDHASSTPFGFATFPESLPRIVPKAPPRECPATVRKRMVFENNNNNNLSLSSMLDDDDSSSDEEARQASTPVPRTRLNFSTVSSPHEKKAGDDDHRLGSLASSLSSRNLSGCSDESSPPRPMAFSNSQAPPPTPREVKLHFQLDAAACSPIPGIPEEDGDVSSKSTGAAFGQRKQLSTSRDSSSTKASARPMPDLHAFEGDASGDGSEMAVAAANRPQSPPRVPCPPTPVRTPAWAHTEWTGPALFPKPGGLKRYGRSNSLIATKVLATCSPQVLDGRASLENSTLEEGDSRDSSKSGTEAAKDSDTWLHDNRAPKQESPNVPQTVVSMATDFDVLSTLGSGNFADVYRVRSKIDGRLYAVKRNRRQFRGTRDREKALAEVKYMQRLQSVCTRPAASNSTYSLYLLFFYQAWQEDGHFFSQTELCCRDTCRELMDSLRFKWRISQSRYPSLRSLPPPPSAFPGGSPSDCRLFPEATVWKICHDVGAGLLHIHSHGIVHFDIKPSNIFLVAHARLGAMCKIGDFGMAGDIGSSEDGQEGDQLYMAPELLTSDQKHPSADIFSLGMTLYELASSLSFVLPSDGDRWHEIRSGRHKLDVPSTRSHDLVLMLQAMLRPNRDERPTAQSILSANKVATTGATCDTFLRDYIKDIADYDAQEDLTRSCRKDDETPRQVVRTICSPPVGAWAPKPPLMHSPEAQQSCSLN